MSEQATSAGLDRVARRNDCCAFETRDGAYRITCSVTEAINESMCNIGVEKGTSLAEREERTVLVEG